MHVVVLAGGDAGDRETWREWLDRADLIVGADGGAAHALALGTVPDAVLGDLDSLPAADRARLEALGVRFEVHPCAKDETDLELALLWAVGQGAAEVTLLGALGGRVDHTLANLLLLADPRWAGVRLRLVGDAETVFALHGGSQATLEGRPGDRVSLLPVGGEAVGVHTEGLAWPLNGDTLLLGRTRGVSNEMVACTARVWLEQGTLLVVHVKREVRLETI